MAQKPGIGTILNAMIIAGAIEYSLPHLPHPDGLFIQLIQIIIGVFIVGLGSGIYLIANLGPGPRDGLMTGIQRKTGFTIAIVRTTIEITAVGIGWLLGGIVGIGTVIFALGIGPAVAMGIIIVQNISSRK